MAQDTLARHLTSVPTETDYESFCDTLGASARGRWFLAEYTRRNRNADTEVLLTALGRIEALVSGTNPQIDRVRGEMRLLLDTLRLARTDVEDTAHENLRAMKLIALVNLLERRIENLVGSGGEPEAAPEELGAQELGAPAMPNEPDDQPAAARVAFTVVPPSEEPQLPLPSVATSPPTIALVAPAAPVPPQETASLIELALDTGDWHPAATEDDDAHAYAAFDIIEPAEQIVPERPAATRPALPDLGLILEKRPDPLAPLRAMSEEERLAIFS